MVATALNHKFSMDRAEIIDETATNIRTFEQHVSNYRAKLEAYESHEKCKYPVLAAASAGFRVEFDDHERCLELMINAFNALKENLRSTVEDFASLLSKAKSNVAKIVDGLIFFDIFLVDAHVNIKPTSLMFSFELYLILIGSAAVFFSGWVGATLWLNP